MRKHHFSRAETRAMALDHPIGDPIGGTAYGEKNDPVSAVISLASMGGTYAAAGSFAAMSVMQGITFAGAALNLVGSVTGNKTLQKIGMVAGIAGGIGQLAGIQGPTLGETFGKIGVGPTTTATAPISGASPTSNLAATPTAQPAQSYAGSQIGPTTVAPTAAPAPAPTPAAPVGTASPGLTNGSSYTGAYTPPDMGIATSDALKTAGAGAGGGVWESVKGAGKSLMEFTKDYPAGAIMLGSTASTLSDYLTGKTDAEIAALEAQKDRFGAEAAQIQEAIDKERRRRKNLEEGYAKVNTGIQVNPNVSIQPAGLIAQQMPQPA